MRWFKKSYFFIFLFTLFYVFSSSYGLVSDVATEMVLASDYVRGKDAALSEIEVIPGGDVIGIKLYTDGVLVVDLAGFEDESGNIVCPAEQSGIQAGDKILEINGEKIESSSEIAEKVKKLDGKKVKILAKREENKFEVWITPIKSLQNGDAKLGIWVRDSAAGIGTITFVDPKKKTFFALGHGITDKDIRKLYSVKKGSIERAEVMSLVKSSEGVPGEIQASFGANGQILGKMDGNSKCGIYGIYDGELTGKPVKVASRWQIKEGTAKILCSLDGNTPAEYDIEILKVMLGGGFSEKSMVIKITDEKLIKKTGGIVQGMSGSPIIQDGKLVGAVTHVFVKDPTKGYGIFIENMLNITK